MTGVRNAFRLVREDLFDKGTFGQRPEWKEGSGIGEGHPGHRKYGFYIQRPEVMA